jgi:hypothetical protein
MKKSLPAFVVMLFVIGGSAMATVPTKITQLLPPPISPEVAKWYQSDVRTGGAASLVDLTGLGGNLETGQPIPTGAAKLTTDFTDAAKAEVSTYADFGLASAVMNDITLGYSFYKQNVSGGNVWAAAAMSLTIQTVGGTGDNYGSLIFEPYWNDPSGSMAPPPTNAWQNVNITSSTGAGVDSFGGWWWNGGFEEASGAAGPPLRSLAEWVSVFQTKDPIDFANAHVVAVSIGVGTYNQGQIAYFDNVSIYSTAGSVSAAYNFEVPEPSTFTMLFVGGLLGLAFVKIRRRRPA